MNIKQTSTVLALVAVSALGIRGAEDKRAHLSDDLLVTSPAIRQHAHA